MPVILPFNDNQYLAMVAVLAQQPNKVLETLPGVGVTAQASQQVQNVWQNGLPQTGNDVVDTLVVNRVNNTVNTTKGALKTTKKSTWRGFLIGGTVGLLAQLVFFTRPTMLKGFKEAFKALPEATTMLKRLWPSIKGAFRALNAKRLIGSSLALGGTGALIGLGIGLTVGVLKSIGQLKNLLWGHR